MTYQCHELIPSLICASYNIIHEVLEFQLSTHFLLAGLDTKESGALGSFALLMIRELKYIGIF